MDVRQLYKVHGVHSYTKGINIRAFIAFMCGIAPDLPGLAAACGAKHVPNGAKYLYSLSWLVAILVSSLVYWISFKIVPFAISPSQEIYMDIDSGVEVRVEQVTEEMEKKQFQI